jgi:hypothetical protein
MCENGLEMETLQGPFHLQTFELAVLNLQDKSLLILNITPTRRTINLKVFKIYLFYFTFKDF